MNNPDDPCHQHAAKIHTIRNLLLRDWTVSLSHVYLEGNLAADYLAGIGHGFPPGVHLIPISDCNLDYFVRRDCMGVSEPRNIVS
ncbi:hypothetical protein LINPERHAP1_LOCUS28357 [Linum perenne]